MNFEVGDVVSVFTDRSKDPKYKMVIVAAESRTNDNFLCVFINTDQACVPFIQKYQPALEPFDYDFLDHTSYADCYTPKEFLASEIKESLLKNPKNKKGKLNEDDLDKIRDLIKENPKIVNALKKQYFYV